VGHCTSGKEIWEKIQNLYSKESLFMTIGKKLVDIKYKYDKEKEPPKREIVSKKSNEKEI